MRVLFGPVRTVCLALLIVAQESTGVPAAAMTMGCPQPDSTEIMLDGARGATTLSIATGGDLVLSALAFPTAPGEGDASGLDGAASILADFRARPVRLATDGVPDRYDRRHAYVYAADGRLLQAELVAAGLAIVRPDGTPPDCVRALLALEATARKAGLGLWQDSRIVGNAMEESSLSARNGLYGLVEGRVVSIGYGSRLVFVDFGRNHRTDFTVMMQNGLIPRLREAGISLESLSGRAVRVRGVIEESGGPAIRIADPFALELLDRTE